MNCLKWKKEDIKQTKLSNMLGVLSMYLLGATQMYIGLVAQ